MLVYLRYFVVALSYADYIIPCFRGWLTSPLEWLYFAVQVALGERFLQQKILHGVNEPYKEVFMWRVYAELSFKQIAQIFGKTENWACVTYHRARKMIKEILEEKNGEN